MTTRSQRTSCFRRVTAWVSSLALFVTLLPAGAQEAPAPPDVARLVPADAVAVAAIDLRSEEPTVRLFLEQLRPQERAIGEAMLAAMAQVGLSKLASGLDLETDVLPWVGRRGFVAGIPAAEEEGGAPRLMALVEVKEAGAAAKALDVLLPKAVTAAGGKYFQRAIGDTLLRHLAIPGFGHLQLMLRENALALSNDVGLLEAWLKQPPAPNTDAEWRKAMRLVAPGPLVLALTPGTAGPEIGGMVAGTGISAGALSVSASQAGTRLEIAVQAPVGLAGKALEQLGRTRVTGEAVGAVPESALATAALAPMGGVLETFGAKSFLTMGLRELLGDQAEKMMPRLQPVLDNVLKGEIAVALLGLTPEPRVLGVLALPDEGAASAAIGAVRDALGMIEGAKVLPGTGGAGGYVVTLPPDQGLPVQTLHIAAAGKTLFAATDAETLQAGITTSRAPRPAGLSGTPAFRNVQEQAGSQAAVVLYGDTRALGKALAALGHQHMRESDKAEVPEKYFVRLIDAFLLPLGGAGLNVSARDGAGHVVLFQQVDWKAGGGVSAGAVPVASILAAIAFPALTRARHSGNEAGALQALRSIRSAQEGYKAEHNRYGNLNQLKAAGDIPLGENEIDHSTGYRFRSRNVTADTYEIVATPQDRGMTTYTLDQNGEITP